ncbi:hypothetical protein GGR55DRAFT_632800 [Xylaria sp. FL0064]|nr:hypothetical protein GGR55DRAFT_632800 [Xylaria sp. FL0064]
MCTETSYTLRCEHVVTQRLYCPDAPPPTNSCSRRERRTCKKCIRNSVPWPPPPEYGSLSRCPLPRCPFEERGGFWNCCWCGKEWNEKGQSCNQTDCAYVAPRSRPCLSTADPVSGRCSCIMIIDRQEYRCDHICCETCEAATEH